VQALFLEQVVVDDPALENTPTKARKIICVFNDGHELPSSPGCAFGTPLRTHDGAKESNRLKKALKKINESLFDDVMAIGGHYHYASDPTSWLVNKCQDKCAGQIYPQQSCLPPGDTNTATGEVSEHLSKIDICLGSTWKVKVQGSETFSYFWVLCMPLDQSIVGIWLWSREEVILQKERAIIKNPTKFIQNNETTKIINAKTNSMPTSTQALFTRPPGMEQDKSVHVVMMGGFLDSVSPKLFVHPVDVVNADTVEYNRAGSKPLYTISSQSMTERVCVPHCFDPDT
jgi:hypothetical protein